MNDNFIVSVTLLMYTGKKVPGDDTGDDVEEEPVKPDSDNADVSDLLKDQLKHDHLTLLSGGSLIGALAEFVTKSENEAISELVCVFVQSTCLTWILFLLVL